QADYEQFRVREGAALGAWSGWCALAEVHGADWRQWPDEVADPRQAEQSLAAGPLAQRAEFHAWLQWLADEQLAAAQRGGLAAAVAIGEDLGTVDPWIRRYLAAHRILGTTMLWFADEPDGTPMRPAHWRRGCMATVGSHDLPTVAGFLSGEQVTVRAQLGLLKQT